MNIEDDIKQIIADSIRDGYPHMNLLKHLLKEHIKPTTGGRRQADISPEIDDWLHD